MSGLNLNHRQVATNLLNLPYVSKSINAKTHASTLSGGQSQPNPDYFDDFVVDYINELTHLKCSKRQGSMDVRQGRVNAKCAIFVKPNVIVGALNEEDSVCKSRAIATIPDFVPSVNIVGSSPVHLFLDLSGQQLFCKINSPLHAMRFLNYVTNFNNTGGPKPTGLLIVPATPKINKMCCNMRLHPLPKFVVDPVVLENNAHHPGRTH